MNCRTLIYNFFVLIIALNYFAFRVELFDSEYSDNHPKVNDLGKVIVRSLLAWETYDKDNAPEAFTISAKVTIEFIKECRLSFHLIPQSVQTFQLVRDKSPPFSSAVSSS